MTLDDVAAEMRDRFTASGGASVQITVEEWNTLSKAIKLADHLEWFLYDPTNDLLAKEAAKLIQESRSKR